MINLLQYYSKTEYKFLSRQAFAMSVLTTLLQVLDLKCCISNWMFLILFGSMWHLKLSQKQKYYSEEAMFENRRKLVFYWIIFLFFVILTSRIFLLLVECNGYKNLNIYELFVARGTNVTSTVSPFTLGVSCIAGHLIGPVLLIAYRALPIALTTELSWCK